VIAKTTQAIIISHYGEEVQAGAAAKTVEDLADYLVGLGY
jgi:profilin